MSTTAAAYWIIVGPTLALYLLVIVVGFCQSAGRHYIHTHSFENYNANDNENDHTEGHEESGEEGHEEAAAED